MKFLLIFFVTFYIVNRIFCAVPEDPQYWRKLTKKTLYYSKKFVHANEIKQAKNAILFLGDGMGFPSISAARLLKRQLTGNYGENLAFEKWDNVAVMKVCRLLFNLNLLIFFQTFEFKDIQHRFSSSRFSRNCNCILFRSESKLWHDWCEWKSAF